MPFTLAHPAVVLPLRHRLLHREALIIGSMSPDFLYFLYGQASQSFGHRFDGFFLVNLPLSFGVFFLYQSQIAPYFWQYLPKFLRLDYQKIQIQTDDSFLKFIIRFSISAIVGMITHVLLDSFTHETGWLVERFDIFHHVILTKPLFKWLQYSGGVLGLVVIFGYWLVLTKKLPLKTEFHRKNAIQYWIKFFSSLFGGLMLWQMLQPIGIFSVATWVIRIIDIAFLSLVMIGLMNNKKWYDIAKSTKI